MLSLSFHPGDLHLSQNEQGLFVLLRAGKEIYKTKSQRVAVAKFNWHRTELEKLLPASAPTAEEKSALLESQVNNSRLTRSHPKGDTRISSAALYEVEVALGAYWTALETSDLAPTSQEIYMRDAENFVQWLKGEYEPGCRLAPYSLKRKTG